MKTITLLFLTGVTMFAQLELRPTFTADPPKKLSELIGPTQEQIKAAGPITKEFHENVVVLTCQDGGVAVAPRGDLIQPSIRLLYVGQKEGQTEYHYEIRNDAKAAREINQVVIWDGNDHPIVYYNAEGIQPGKSAEWQFTSSLSPGFGVKVQMAHASDKMKVDRGPFEHLERHLSYACRAAIEQAHDYRTWDTVVGPVVGPKLTVAKSVAEK